MHVIMAKPQRTVQLQGLQAKVFVVSLILWERRKRVGKTWGGKTSPIAIASSILVRLGGVPEQRMQPSQASV